MHYRTKKKSGKIEEDGYRKNNSGIKNGKSESPDSASQTKEGAAAAQKKIKIISRKLKQIKHIKDQLDAGKTVELNQLESIKREDALKKEIELLEKKLSEVSSLCFLSSLKICAMPNSHE